MTCVTVTRCKLLRGVITPRKPGAADRRCAAGPLTMAFTVVFLALTHLAAMGATWYVAPTGSDSNSGTSWSSPLATIAKAIGNASFGDQVWVKAGTYNLASQINLAQGVSVYGGFNGAETTLSQRNWVTNVTILNGLNGSSSTRIVYAASNITPKVTLLDGFTLLDGHAVAASSNGGYGGGIYCDGAPTISNNIFDGCSASLNGGAVYCSSSSAAVITSNTFQANIAGYGGAIEDDGGATISNNDFLGNNATNGGAFGCGLNGTFSITISGNTFEGNSATQTGGAIWVNGSNGSITITGNTVASNTAGSGGGIMVSGGAPTISGNIVTGNQAIYTNYYENGGGGIYCSYGLPMITNNTISQNTTESYGGGILLLDCDGQIANNTENSPGGAGIAGNTAVVAGGGIFCYYHHTTAPTIQGNAIHGNAAPIGGGILDETAVSLIQYNHFYANFASNSGAGIYENVTTSTLQGNIVEQNGILTSTTPPTETSTGGGIYIYQGGPVLTNNLVLDNVAAQSAAGIEIYNSSATLANNTICSPDITATSPGVGAISIAVSTASPKLANNIVAHNMSGGIMNPGGGPVTLSHNDVYGNRGFDYNGLTADSGSIMADPMFITGYHIPAGSPCVNAGDYTYVTANELDLDGNPRSRDGVHVDIGCYEYTPATAGLVGFTVSSNSLCSQVTAIGTVTLAAPAPSGGATVFLSSSDSVLVAVPPTMVVPAGQTSATFTITADITATMESTTLYAAMFGTVLTVNVTVSPLLNSVSFNPIDVIGGATVLGSVNLNCPAPTATTINLISSDPSVTVPASVTVAAGATGATFKVMTAPTTVLKMVTVTATNGIESATGTLYVDPTATLTALTIAPSSVIGGGTVRGVVTLKSAAPAGGIDVALSVNDATASVPTVVTVPAGRKQGSFQISTTAVAATQTISVTASLGSISKSAKLTVNPITVASVTLVPSTVAAGDDAFLIVTLTAPAGPGGVIVILSSDNLGVAAPDQAMLVIPEGQTTGAAYVDTYADGIANIGAALAGITKAAKLTVKN